MRKLNNILITGGAGFIGSNFIDYLFEKIGFKGNVINVDKLTYAGNMENLEHIDKKYGSNGENRYFFEKTDIVDYENLNKVFTKYDVDTVIHFAAESHVDRSIHGPKEFMETNIIGTFNLLEIVRKLWNDRKDVIFHHISTDEVYGSLGETGFFYENTPYDPRNPYSASKASADHIVNSYFHTYNLPITMSNCSNNYGALQFPEKLIPIMINNMLEEKPLPVYGDGLNIRDWLYVEDHCSGIWKIVNNGMTGETYNIGGENEWTNIDLLNNLCEIVAKKTNKEQNYYKKLITYVNDRAGHDRRYAINCDKIKSELNWAQSVTFEEGLDKTVDWYLKNTAWIENIKTGEYKQWIEKNYDGNKS
jgi:dTDP-glucose 4,6-dehydratase